MDEKHQKLFDDLNVDDWCTRHAFCDIGAHPRDEPVTRLEYWMIIIFGRWAMPWASKRARIRAVKRHLDKDFRL